MRDNLLEWYKRDLISWINCQAMTEDGVKEEVYQDQIDRDMTVIAAFEALEEIVEICFNGFEYLQDQSEINFLQNLLEVITSRFGHHEERQGWSPQKKYCGECSDYNCIGCSHSKEKL